ncbi:MAG TPA: twin-arginine translocase TatA/TatE family subunit [Solirubrobacteraceae bacterium]|jgi:sec-independent protein translocase protein TatA|nr:twin-arginine translocase TatA/TatE family subunit [Solirubrobacteraceae bacterium]
MGLDNPLHIAFLLIVLLLVFGAKRLPEVGRSLGSGLRGFKDAISGDAAAQALPSPPQQQLAAAAPVAQPTATVAPATPASASQEPAPSADVTQLPHAGRPMPPAA